MARVAAKPLEFAPGERYNYSNSGYMLLGWIIEVASGESYETFLRENILQPLGMKDSGLDSVATIIPQRAAGYERGPKGLTNARYFDPEGSFASGGIYSTPADLLRWTQALFGGKVLSAASLAQMTTPVKNNYAFGLGVRTIKDRKVISHNGRVFGFNSHLSYYPESQVAVVVLANLDGPDALELVPQITALALGESVTLPFERKEIELPVATLQKYVGMYQLNEAIAYSIRLVDGRLTTQATNQEQSPMFPESDKAFFLRDVDVQVEFVVDGQGRVTDLVMHQGGSTRKARRFSDTVIEHRAISLPRTTLETYVGTYEIENRPGRGLTVTMEGDQLMGQPMGGPRMALFAEAEGKFFFKAAAAQVEFVKDAVGTITRAAISAGGRDIKAVRK